MAGTSLTYRYVVNDLKISLKQIFPDAEIPTASVTFWVRSTENYIRQRTLRVQATGSYLNEYYGPNALPVQTDGIKKWISIPAAGIYDLDFEKGVEYISINDPLVSWGQQVRFTQTYADRIDRLYYEPYEVPSPSNPYFYRVGNNIFLLGIEGVAVVSVNAGFYSALDPRPVLLPMDSPLGINDEQYITLREMVMSIGRNVLIIPNQRSIDGTDDREVNAKELGRANNPQQE